MPLAAYQNLTKGNLINELVDSTISVIVLVACLLKRTLKDMPLTLVVQIKGGHHYLQTKAYQGMVNKLGLLRLTSSNNLGFNTEQVRVNQLSLLCVALSSRSTNYCIHTNRMF